MQQKISDLRDFYRKIYESYKALLIATKTNHKKVFLKNGLTPNMCQMKLVLSTSKYRIHTTLNLTFFKMYLS